MTSLSIDARESKLIKRLQDRGESFISACLPIGDILLHGSDGIVVAVIERKTISDLIMSIKDSRYTEQKKRLGMSYPRSAIMYVIESDSEWDSLNEMVKGAIINTMLRDDIKVFMTKSVRETCSLVCDMMARIRKDPAKYAMSANSEYSDSLAQVASAAKKRDQMDQRTFSILSLSLVPGVSKVIAKTVVDAFGNISDIIIANDPTFTLKLADLKMASGKRLGPNVASRIVHFLSSSPKNVNDIETLTVT